MAWKILNSLFKSMDIKESTVSKVIPDILDKTSFNVKIFDWDYLHLTAQTKETYFSPIICFWLKSICTSLQNLQFHWKSWPIVPSFSVIEVWRNRAESLVNQSQFFLAFYPFIMYIVCIQFSRKLHIIPRFCFIQNCQLQRLLPITYLIHSVPYLQW